MIADGRERGAGLELGEDHGGATGRHQQAPSGDAADMEQRQEREELGTGSEAARHLDAEHRERERALAQHDPFGESGGAAGVEERGSGLLGRFRRQWAGRRCREQIVEPRIAWALAVAHHHHVLERGQAPTDVGDHGRKGRVDEQHARA